jgi:hypothetical protein
MVDGGLLMANGSEFCVPDWPIPGSKHLEYRHRVKGSVKLKPPIGYKVKPSLNRKKWRKLLTISNQSRTINNRESRLVKPFFRKSQGLLARWVSD